MGKKRIALFASGSGTNAQNIIEYFSDNEGIVVDSLWSNKRNAYALVRAENMGVKTFIFNREAFYQTDQIIDTLKKRKTDLIVLAGFLWLIPQNLIENFTIINIHPALLPKYGGKGMYGMNVHKAVIDNKEKESGISIHYVNEKYDEGEIIFQARCKLLPTDKAEDVAKKVHQLEYEHFPAIIERVVNQL
jgi:phosphoribosylglycinamide formyltransferase-1